MSNEIKKGSKEKEMKMRHHIAMQSCPKETLSDQFARINNYVQRCMSNPMVCMLH
jgi:hypothetical protein